MELKKRIPLEWLENELKIIDGQGSWKAYKEFRKKAKTKIEKAKKEGEQHG
jgi:hypothetical protein